jgi:hypothetical protein
MPYAPFPVKDPAYEMLDYIERRMAWTKVQPIYLGGEPGSSGSIVPPGGFIGLLSQNKVQYDSVEAEYSSGGSTLMDNLAHDRYRLTTYMNQLAAYSGGSLGAVEAGDYPSWGAGAALIGFSPGSPAGVYSVQTAIESIYNMPSVGGNGFMWHSFVWSVEGALSQASLPLEWSVPGPMTIDHVYLRCKDTPSGGSIIVDVNKNGSTIFATQSNRPKIVPGDKAGASGTPDTTSVTTNDYLTADVDDIGSTFAGTNLTIHVRCKQYLQA